MAEPLLIEAEAAAELLGFTARDIYVLARTNQLPDGVVIRLGERKVRFSRPAIEAWLGARSNGPSGQARLVPNAVLDRVEGDMAAIRKALERVSAELCALRGEGNEP